MHLSFMGQLFDLDGNLIWIEEASSEISFLYAWILIPTHRIDTQTPSAFWAAVFILPQRWRARKVHTCGSNPWVRLCNLRQWFKNFTGPPLLFLIDCPCQCLSVSWQQKPKWWRQKAVWVLIQSSRLLSGSFHMQNTRLALGRRGRWQLQPHIELPLETHTSDWLTNEKGWNSFH